MLGWDIGHALPDLRRHAESLMDSTVTVRRKTGEERDKETGTMVPTWEVVYAGVARVRMPASVPRELDQAGQRVVESSPSLSLPIGDADAVLVRLDDVVTVDAHDLDPLLVGTEMRVVRPVQQTHSTARRFVVEIIAYAQGVSGG